MQQPSTREETEMLRSIIIIATERPENGIPKRLYSERKFVNNNIRVTVFGWKYVQKWKVELRYSRYGAFERQYRHCGRPTRTLQSMKSGADCKIMWRMSATWIPAVACTQRGFEEMGGQSYGVASSPASATEDGRMHERGGSQANEGGLLLRWPYSIGLLVLGSYVAQ